MPKKQVDSKSSSPKEVSAVAKTSKNVTGFFKPRTGLIALYQKEMSDYISSRRFTIILVIIIATTLTSLYGALTSLASTTSSTDTSTTVSTTFMFLKLFTSSGNSIPSFTSFIALLGPFIGLTLGFDAINNERSEGTLNRLLSQPIYRDGVIIGKFLAGCSIIFITIFSMGILIGSIGLVTIGIPPSSEELARLITYLFFTSVYIAFWLALSMLFSVFCRHAATSALASIAVWLVCAIFISLVAGMVANAVFPISQTSDVTAQVNNYTLELGLNRISPYYLFSEAASTIMNPSVRSINVVTMESLSGAISSYLSFGQSLLLVWPHLTALIALTLISFAISYFNFMRQEIRS